MKSLGSRLALFLLSTDPDDVAGVVAVLYSFAVHVSVLGPLLRDLDLDIVVLTDPLDVGAASAHDRTMVLLLDYTLDRDLHKH